MKIYTRTGDAGTTGLIGGSRITKDSDRICAIGDVDELNAALGSAASMIVDPEILGLVKQIQCRLFDVGAELARVTDVVSSLNENEILELEKSIDKLTEELPPLKAFILPGGDPGASALHVARAVCRRAERSVLALNRTEPVSHLSRTYLNRLSDWLFVCARVINGRLGIPETEWHAAEVR